MQVGSIQQNSTNFSARRISLPKSNDAQIRNCSNNIKKVTEIDDYAYLQKDEKIERMISKDDPHYDDEIRNFMESNQENKEDLNILQKIIKFLFG